MTKKVSKYFLGKGIFTALQTVIFVVCIYLIDLPLTNKIFILGGGIIVGFIIGKIRWYFSKNVDEGIKFSLILALGESVLIIPIIAIFFIIIYYGTLSSILGIMSTWLGYVYIMLFNIYSYEKQHGVLPVKPVYPRVANGLESMIDKTATVHSPCNPIGTIKYNSVIWNAETIDGIELQIGKQVIIRDVNGLKTIIEKI